MTSNNETPLNGTESRFDRNVWLESTPFHHLVIDDFLSPSTANAVAREFPTYEDAAWRVYDNAIEVKKLQNHWDKFGPATYRLFSFLNSRAFIETLEVLVGEPLYADMGLNGGGLHSHRSGGKLNPHLDYSIHPKLGLERRINLLIYLTPGWEESWGGTLGLWDINSDGSGPGTLQVEITPKHNRAVLFDTTQDSWHGLPKEVSCPQGVTRNSLAVYYLCTPRAKAAVRGKALFSPTEAQQGNPEILELIAKRSSVATASEVYGDRKP